MYKEIRKNVPKDIEIVVVSKKRTIEEINRVVKEGAITIGEGTLQEALGKFPYLLPCRKHFIGHLQSNKVRKVVENFDVIQSVDSIKIAKEIDYAARDLGKVQEVYMQVNIGREDSKYGVYLDEAEDLYSKLIKLTNIKVTGIMCIAPYGEDARPYFKQMKELFDRLPVKVLSMGMSSDYKVAIEEGATQIRLGRAIFG